MIPLNDLNPTRRFPIITFLLIGLNILVFIWQQTFEPLELEQLFRNSSVVPALMAHSPIGRETLLDVLRSLFFHGSWMHLIGNMLYLYLFGDNVEDRLGRLIFPWFYFWGGYAAAIAQVIINPSSEIPLVGASGAVAAILGSYLLLYPQVQVRGIIPLGIFSRLVQWPAWIVLALWFVLQLFNALFSFTSAGQGPGIAFFAHIGGFLYGLFLTRIFLSLVVQPEPEKRRKLLYERAQKHRF